MAGSGLASTQKKAKREKRTLILLDESGFYLLPSISKTYAPEGMRTELRVKLTRDHLSVIGAVTPCGKVFASLHEEALNAGDVVDFLIHLIWHLPNKLLVVWDGSPIHFRSLEVQFFLASVKNYVHVEAFPPYAPDLNPCEGLWEHLKNDLKNVCSLDFNDLTFELRLALMRVRSKPWLIQEFFGQPKLDISEFKKV